MSKPPKNRSRYRFMPLAILLLVSGIYLIITTLAPLLLHIPPLQQEREKQVEAEIRQPVSTTNTLFIPTIGVSIPIIEGTDESALLQGAWHRVPANGDPQRGGNFVLSAHRFDMGYTPMGTIQKSPLYNLHYVKIGDKLTVNWEGSQYNYTVTEITDVTSSQTFIEQRTDTPRLTLYSCTLRGALDGRLVVIATPKP